MSRLFLCLSMCLVGMSSAAFSADTDRDRDRDSYSDLDEINSNSDPLSDNSIPAKGLQIWLLKAAKDKMEKDSTNQR